MFDHVCIVQCFISERPLFSIAQRLLASLPSEHLPDICSTMVKASYAEKLQVLDAVDLTQRFKKALPLLMRQIEVQWHIQKLPLKKLLGFSLCMLASVLF